MSSMRYRNLRRSGKSQLPVARTSDRQIKPRVAGGTRERTRELVGRDGLAFMNDLVALDARVIMLAVAPGTQDCSLGQEK